MPEKIRILIADNNLIDREGTQRILERESDMEIIAVARTPPEASQLCIRYHPDVLILDLKWEPDTNVLEPLIHQIITECPDTAILGLTAYPKFSNTARNAGLKWTLHKDVNKDDLIQAVRAVFYEKRKDETQDLSEAFDAMGRIKARPLGQDYSEHEKDVSIILYALLKPHLSNPRLQPRTTDGVQRRDIVFSNNSDSGFWHRMREKYEADQIVFEVKNVTEVESDHFRQIASYLIPAFGRLGFLVTRKSIAKELTTHAISIFHNEKKLILALCDNDLMKMLELKKAGQDPVELLQQHYDDFITQP